MSPKRVIVKKAKGGWWCLISKNTPGSLLVQLLTIDLPIQGLTGNRKTRVMHRYFSRCLVYMITVILQKYMCQDKEIPKCKFHLHPKNINTRNNVSDCETLGEINGTMKITLATKTRLLPNRGTYCMFQSLPYKTQESPQRWEEHPAYCIPGRGLLQVQHSSDNSAGMYQCTGVPT